MVALLFVLVMFNSVIIAMGCVIYATTVRKLRKEVNKLEEENRRLSCSEHSLLWQRKNLRNEIKRLVLDRYYWGNLKQWMHEEVMKGIRSPEFHKMDGVNRVQRLEEETFRKHYKW